MASIKRVKKSLSLVDIKKEISAIAQGQYNIGPYESELRLKSLKALADILLKEKQAGVEQKTAIKPITIKVIEPGSSDQEERVANLENSIMQVAEKDGEV